MIMFVLCFTPLLPVSLFRYLLLAHDIFKSTPEGLNRREFVSHGDDGLQVTIQFVDICENMFETLFIEKKPPQKYRWGYYFSALPPMNVWLTVSESFICLF